MSEQLELWTSPTPNGWKVAIMVEELKAHGHALKELKIRHVDLANGDHRSDEFTAHNPNQKIPVLVDGERSIIESCAILQYLGEKYESTLLPLDERRWDVLPWLYWQAANVGPAFGNRQSYIRYMDDVPEAEKSHPQARFLAEARRLAAVIETRLEQQDFICGESLTVADIAIYPWFRGWKWSKVDMTDRPNILNWMRRIRARPAVERGLAWGAADGEVDQWSEATKARYAKGGASIATQN